MTENITLNTTIHEPPYMGTGEVEMLLFSLERSRAQFAYKVGDLDAAALRRPFPPSTMTLGGLVKHLALVEDRHTAGDVLGVPINAPWDKAGVDFDEDPDWEFRTAADHSPEELYTLWHDAVERSRAAWAKVLANGSLDQPSARTNVQVNLRRILVDLTDEYPRHVGHADLFREAIDGRVGEDPPQHR